MAGWGKAITPTYPVRGIEITESSRDGRLFLWVVWAMTTLCESGLGWGPWRCKGRRIWVKRSCQYCGRFHSVGYECPMRPKRKKQGKREAEQTRSSYAWQKKREAIKKRDHYLCVYSLSQGRIVYGELEVHHITPLEERPDLAFEDGNLITLCKEVHERAERGEISREELLELVRHPPPGGGDPC